MFELDYDKLICYTLGLLLIPDVSKPVEADFNHPSRSCKVHERYIDVRTLNEELFITILLLCDYNLDDFNLENNRNYYIRLLKEYDIIENYYKMYGKSTTVNAKYIAKMYTQDEVNYFHAGNKFLDETKSGIVSDIINQVEEFLITL